MQQDEFWSIVGKAAWGKLKPTDGRATLRALLVTSSRAQEFLWWHNLVSQALLSAIEGRISVLSDPADRQALLDHVVGEGHLPYLMTLFDQGRARKLAWDRSWGDYRGDILVEAYLMARGPTDPPPLKAKTP